MTIYKDKLHKPKSCYDCVYNGIIHEGQSDEWWACDEMYGVPVGTNPPHDEPCSSFREKEELLVTIQNYSKERAEQ